MRINHNITAMLANNTLSRNDNAMAQAIERLSSGYRINYAKDDAAGLAISQKMRTQIRGLQQANSNAGDGISVVQTAEGALIEVHSILQRMKELTVQAANDVYTPEDRQTIQNEIDELNKEVQRISDATHFNQRYLLNGDIGRATYIDTGSVIKGVSAMEVSESVNVDEYSFTVTQDARQAVAVGGSIAMTAGDKITAAQAGTIKINGETVEIKEGDTADEVYAKIKDLCEWTGNKVFTVDSMDNTSGTAENAGYEPSTNSFGNGGNLVIVSNYYGSSEHIDISCTNTQLADMLGIKDGITVGSDVGVTLMNGYSPTAVVATDGNTITISDSSGFEMVFEAKLGACGTSFTDPVMGGATTSTASGGTAFKSNVRVLEAGQMVLQIGANQNDTMTVTIPQMSPKNLDIDDINVVCGEDARAAIDKIDAAIAKVSDVRAKLGAYQNRLEHTESNLEIAEESMTESISRILDCDMAGEVTEYTQQNLLVQTAVNMLAKANARPESVLQLLQQS